MVVIYYLPSKKILIIIFHWNAPFFLLIYLVLLRKYLLSLLKFLSWFVFYF